MLRETTNSGGISARRPALTLGCGMVGWCLDLENEIQFHFPYAMLQTRIDDHAPPTREAMREAQDIFFKHLKRVGLKHTEQRDTILRTFLETRDHLSTDQLFRLVRKKDPKIGFT